MSAEILQFRTKGDVVVGGDAPSTGGTPVPRSKGENIVLPPRQQPYTMAEVFTHSPDYRASLMPEKERWHGPPCICESRNTAFIGTGRRHCKTCGLVEFGMTPNGYRGIRKVEAR